MLVNDATVVLDGADAQITNAAFLNALADFGEKTLNGNFTIQNERNLAVSGGLDNAGNMTFGDSSTFQIGAEQTYLQTTGIITNSATVSTATIDANSTNDTATEDTTVNLPRGPAVVDILLSGMGCNPLLPAFSLFTGVRDSRATTAASGASHLHGIRFGRRCFGNRHGGLRAD